MKKKKINLKERFKNAKNPLSGIKTRDLIITLAVLLICFFSGFFGGYACNTSCKRVEVSADERAVTTTYTKVFAQNFVTYFPTGNSNLFFSMAIPSTISGINGLFPFSLIAPSDNAVTPNELLSKPYSAVASAFQKIDDYHITIDRASYGFSAADMVNWFMYQLYYDYDSDADEYIYRYDEDLAEGTANVWYTGLSSDVNQFMTFSSLLINRYGFRINYVTDNGSYLRLYIMIDSSILYETFMAYMDANFGQYYTFVDFFGSDLGAAFDEGYDLGKSDGLTEGKELGRLEGDREGYDRGKTEGEDIGYQRGIRERLEDITPWQHIVDGVNGFLNIQLFPGVRFSLLLSLAFGLILLGFAIKIFLGG